VKLSIKVKFVPNFILNEDYPFKTQFLQKIFYQILIFFIRWLKINLSVDEKQNAAFIMTQV